MSAAQASSELSQLPTEAPPQPAPAPKKNSSKCSALGCTDRAVKIVGDCRYCASKFCSRHRLPEAHACPNIQSCRQDATARLSDRLMGEKCVASKV